MKITVTKRDVITTLIGVVIGTLAGPVAGAGAATILATLAVPVGALVLVWVVSEFIL